MPAIIGLIGKSGSPCIKLRIEGTFPGSGQEFEVTVDTGFTGFISMPIMSALPLGLALYGTTKVTFGDGNTVSRFTALGVAHLSGVQKAGVIILEPNTSTILVGMAFLTAFEQTVLMHRGVLILIDQSDADKAIPLQIIEDLKTSAAALENAKQAQADSALKTDPESPIN